MLQVRVLPGLGLNTMFGKIGSFVSETRQELNKVAWPSRNELLQATIVVIVTTFMIAAFIAVCDFFLSILMRIVIG